MPALKNQKHEAKDAAKGTPLDNAAHENFAQAVAEGVTATAAYREHVAEEGSKTSTCMTEGCTLLASPKVARRVAELRKSFREVLENRLGVRQETIARKLMEIIETPVEEVANTERSPLAQKIKRKRLKVGRGEDAEEWEVEEVETPGKLEAIEKLNRMAGWYEPEKQEHSGEIKIVIQKL